MSFSVSNGLWPKRTHIIDFSDWRSENEAYMASYIQLSSSYSTVVTWSDEL